MPNASAPVTASAMATTDARNAPEVARIRRHASPISARSSVRIAPAMDVIASEAPARAGAIASTAATPAIAKVDDWTWNPFISTAAATPTAPEPTSAMARRGSLPSSPRSGPAMAATRLNEMKARVVC